MRDTMPEVISAYFRAAEAGDLDALIACFTDDATVSDEERTWRGHAGIRTWRLDVATKYVYTLEVLGSEPVAADVSTVNTRLEGSFPGSPVELVYRFTVRNGLISALEIG